jgi:hypothetical protein
VRATSVGNLALFAGGLANGGVSSVVDIYNVSSNTWTTASLSQARVYLAATSVGNLAFFAGGGTFANGGQIGGYSSLVDIYNASSNTWTTASLSQPRRELTATSVGDLALFAGGLSVGAAPTYFSIVDIYNASSNSWTTASLSQARDILAATSLGDLAFFAGGENGTDSSVVDIYNASSNTWTTASLSQPRQALAATSVGGLAFFAGGNSNGVTTSVVDIYTEAPNTRCSAFVFCTSGSGTAHSGSQCSTSGSTVTFSPIQPVFQYVPSSNQNISAETTLFDIQSSTGTTLAVPLLWNSQSQNIFIQSSSSSGMVYTTVNDNFTLQVAFVGVTDPTTLQLVPQLPAVQALAQSVKFVWLLTLHSLSLFSTSQDMLNWNFDIILNNINASQVTSQQHHSSSGSQATTYQVMDTKGNTLNLLLENQALLDNTTLVTVNSSVSVESLGNGSSVLKVNLVFPAFNFSLIYDPNMSMSVLQTSPSSTNQLYYLFLLVLIPVLLGAVVLTGVFVVRRVDLTRKNRRSLARVHEKSLESNI